MSNCLKREAEELIMAFEANSADLIRNSEAMKLLIARAGRGELTAEEVDAQAQELVAVSDRLQEQRRQLVSAYKNVNLRVPRPDKPTSRD
jgi:hypothetical protein